MSVPRPVKWISAIFGVVVLGVASVLGLRFGTAARRRHQSEPNRQTQTCEVIGEDGSGMAILVNPASGSADEDVLGQLRQQLPAAAVTMLDDPSELEEAAERVASLSETKALGVCGGDGSLNTSVAVALKHELPFAAFPGGTLNHFARDLGIESMADAIAAVQGRQVTGVDVARVDNKYFINTFSLGSYVDLVDARERLEPRIGKWSAVLVALPRVLHRSEPITMDIDSKRHDVWMVFVGNGLYKPSGFAPGWRADLDEGLLDVRIVFANHPYSRSRLFLAVLSGRLGRCRAYGQRRAPQVEFSLPDDTRMALDGETVDGSRSLTITKDERTLSVFVP